MRLRTALLASTAAPFLAALVLAAPAHAQFAPGPNPITGTTGAQTLTGGTGTIDAGGKISANTSGTALAVSGTATLTNNGTIEQLGSGRAIDSNSGTATLAITNNGTISAVSTDAFRINTAATSVTLDNTGTISVSAGGQAIDWAAIVTGTNKLTNAATGIISTVGEDAVRPGQGGTIINAGAITATPTGTTSPSGSDGIDLRSNANVSITNSGTISGRHGVTGDAAVSTLTVDNKAGGTIQGVNGSGLNIDTVATTTVLNVTNAQGATIQGGVLAAATNGDGDGIDTDGILHLTNAGNVLGRGAKGVGSDTLPNNTEAVSIGGGSITNTATGRIVADGTLTHGDSTRAANGILADNSSGGSAIAATNIDNAGLIEGKQGFAAKMVGSFADTVVNKAGASMIGHTSEAALQTGGGNDSVTNAGTLANLATGTPTGAPTDQAPGAAADLGDGDDTMAITGTAASVTGNLDGGTGIDTLIFDLTIAGTFSYGDEILNFEKIFVLSGTVTLTDVYVGANTNVDGGTLRFLGDQSSNQDFLNLVSDARVHGHTAGYTYDGTYTTLSQVPEPATLALFGTGLLGLATLRRRRPPAA